MDNKTEKMKEFKDLEFNGKEYIDGKIAQLEFDNGYGVSVICGFGAYGNNDTPYELAILKNGSLCYDTKITDDVIGYLSPDDVTDYMKQVQEL